MLRSFWLAGAVAMILMSSGATQAATLVSTDAGNLASFQLTNLGGGNYSLALTPPFNLTRVNGVSVSIPATFDAVLNFSATVSGNDITITSGHFTKTFGSGDNIASLAYRLNAGLIGSGLNSNGLILAGNILAVAPNALAGYDFSAMVGGIHTYSLTGATYTGGAHSIADVFATTGASVIGSGGYSESAVPEPASMALLGIGLTGLLTVRRYLQRVKFAA